MLTCLLHRDAAFVAVAGEPALVGALVDQCAPWIDAKPARHVPPGCWTVFTDAWHAPAGRGWSPVPAGEPGPAEPRRQLRIDPAARLLALGNDPGPWPARFALRLVRALIRRQLHARGDLYLHAGAVVVERTGIAVAGPARSGKTSTLIALLASGAQSRFVANDDLSARWNGGVLSGLGWPRGVEIRTDMLAALGSLGVALSGAQNKIGASPGSLHLRPHQLAELAGASIATSTPISLIAFPRFTDTPSGLPRIVRLNPAAAADLIAAQMQVPDEVDTWLDPYFTTPDSPRHAETARRIAAAVPAFRVEQSAAALLASATALAASAIGRAAPPSPPVREEPS